MPIQTRPPLTAIIPTGNSESVVRACIESVLWANEILICDSYSNDQTLPICRDYPCRIVQRSYDTPSAQKNWALQQATHDWVLFVDSDERVTARLQAEILDTLKNETPFGGYKIPRLNYVWGRPVYHGGYWPDYQLRLFRRSVGRYDNRPVHENVELDGPSGVLQQPLIHYTHRTMTQTLGNLLVRWTPLEAVARQTRGEKFNLSALLLRPPAAFFYRYLWRQGYRDGWRGLILALIWSCYVALTYMHLWETEQKLPPDWWQEAWQNEKGRTEA